MALKRCLDVAAAAWALVVLSPVLAACALLVKFSSPGPVLFSQPRVGRRGRLFRMWKFRTMFQNGDEILARHLENDPAAREEWRRYYKLKKDPRVTPVGRILRRYSLDELPQFWNVLRGDMSLVGPRPYLEREVAPYAHEIGPVIAVRPGLTGLWQISGRNRTTFEERLRMDQRYFTGWSLRNDLAILLKTVRVVCTGDGAY
jgi:Undecaprenyl-phosphate galactose phosphotransferase WbaP